MFDDMLSKMGKGQSEFFEQKKRARGETIALTKKQAQPTGK